MSSGQFLKQYGNEDGSIKRNFAKILHSDFQIIAKQMLKPMNGSFEITDFYYTVIQYFAKNEKFFDSPVLFNKENANFNKGLLICGANGVGKTFMFRGLHKLNPLLNMVDNGFAMSTSKEVISKFNVNGHKELQDYFKGQRYFDDIGSEEDGTHYGKSEVFRILLETRYDTFINTGDKTFFTTNLSVDDLAVRYGDRAESRIFEMFNLILAKGKDFRK